MALIYDQEVDQGATFEFEFQYLNSAGGPVDLTGVVMQMQAREEADSSAAIFDLSTTNGKITVDIPTAKVVAKMLPAETALLGFDHAEYDFKVTWPSGKVEIWFRGKLTLNLAVTR